MFELALALGTVAVISMVASADDQSAFLWGAITFVVCAAALFLIPLPFLRIFIAGIVSFGLMFGYKIYAER